MTGNLFLDGFIVFFVCYGLIEFLHTISEALLARTCKTAAQDFSVLYIPEYTETLELAVRCAIQKSLAERKALVVLYGELPEEEILILWRLCDDFKHVFIAQKEDATDAFLSAYKASSK